MATSLELTWAAHGDLVVIRTAGYLNRPGGEAVGRLADRLLNAGYTNFLVDLERTRVVNHNGLAELFDLEDRIDRAHGRLSLCGTSPTVRKILNILDPDHEADLLSEHRAGSDRS